MEILIGCRESPPFIEREVDRNVFPCPNCWCLCCWSDCSIGKICNLWWDQSCYQVSKTSFHFIVNLDNRWMFVVVNCNIVFCVCYQGGIWRKDEGDLGLHWRWCGVHRLCGWQQVFFFIVSFIKAIWFFVGISGPHVCIYILYED